MLAAVLGDLGTRGDLPLAAIVMGLLGGLALFLFGMEMMADALKLVAGDGMRKVLARITTNRFTGVLAGASVTAVIQSSSVTTVLVVGFISAGLMNLTQAIGVIMGANIGTTVTAQIIAFKVTKFALVLLAAGFFLQFIFRNEKVQHYGKVVMGLGLIFFGMQLMGDGMRPLQSFEPFIDFMKRMDSPLLAIMFGALFTGLVQSSSATTGIVIVLASQGFLSLEAAIALIFGANIGTCVTAALAALGKPREAKRAVLVHILFNVAGVAVWFAFIPELRDLVTWLSPHSHGDPASPTEGVPRQIANAHAVFNISNTFLFIWFAGPLARLVTWMLPDRVEQVSEAGAPKFLESSLLVTPALALDMVRMELGRLGAAVLRVTRKSLRTVIHGSRADLQELWRADTEIDALHEAIIAYLGELSQQNLDDRQSEQLHRYLSAANYFENIGDMVETSLVDAGRNRCDANLRIGERTEALLVEFHEEVCRGVDHAIRSLVENDLETALQVAAAKERIGELADRMDLHLSQRLIAGEPNRLIAFRLESEIIEYLKRMFYFAKRIAKLVEDGARQEEELEGETQEEEKDGEKDS